MAKQEQELINAVKTGDLDRVKEIVRNHKDNLDLHFEDPDEGYNAAHYTAVSAACQQRKTILEHLLSACKSADEKSALLCQKDRTEGNTLLHLAAKFKKYHFINCLVKDHGANTTLANNAGWLPIHFAADVRNKPAILDNLYQDGINNLDYDPNTYSPVQIAAIYRSLPALKWFYNQKFKFGPHRGITLFHILACSKHENADESLEIIKWLCSTQLKSQLADAAEMDFDDADFNLEIHRGDTPLHVSARYLCPSLCQTLVSLVGGMHRFALNSQGDTALYTAAIRNDGPEDVETRILCVKPFLQPIPTSSTAKEDKLFEKDKLSTLEKCIDHKNYHLVEIFLLNSLEIDRRALVKYKREEIWKLGNYWLNDQILPKLYESTPESLVNVLIKWDQMFKDKENDKTRFLPISGCPTDVNSEVQPTFKNLAILHVANKKETRRKIFDLTLVKEFTDEEWGKITASIHFYAAFKILILLLYMYFSSYQYHSVNLLQVILVILCLVMLLFKEVTECLVFQKLKYFQDDYNLSELAFCVIGLLTLVLALTYYTDEDERLKSDTFWTALICSIFLAFYVGIKQLKFIPFTGVFIGILIQVFIKTVQIFFVVCILLFSTYFAVFRLIFDMENYKDSILPWKLFTILVGELTFDETVSSYKDSISSYRKFIGCLIFASFIFIGHLVTLGTVLAVAVNITKDMLLNAETDIMLWKLHKIQLRYACEDRAPWIFKILNFPDSIWKTLCSKKGLRHETQNSEYRLVSVKSN